MLKPFIGQLPHQFSDGSHQRMLIIQALACEAQLLVADEAGSMRDGTLRAGVRTL
ncbi:ATP-binding cassette domain-containing protein [Ferrimicrobium sp.]|uniref:ATP-binding cassette domain-containing protein n=1 Tax=Ferrimicrobium sp. TaxID=2926050 RepID=UPI00344C6B2D